MLLVGDLIFVHGDDPVSRLIEWAESGKYSHVALYIGSGQLIEAQGGELIKVVPLSKYSNYDVARVKDLQDSQRFELVHNAIQQEGLRYDRILIFILFLRLKLHINIPYTERAMRICSTFIRRCFLPLGIVLTDIENCTPEELSKSEKITFEVE